MKPRKKLIVSAFALAALTAGAWAQNPPSVAAAPKDGATAPAPSTVTAADVQALKDALAAQQLQIDRLTQLLAAAEPAKLATGSPAASSGSTGERICRREASEQHPARWCDLKERGTAVAGVATNCES